MHLGRKDWMTQNKLELNDDKTEAPLIKTNITTLPNAQPTSLRVGSADSPFTTCARNLGFMISDNMSLHLHISNVCLSAYVEIRRISSTRQCLTVEASKTPSVFVLSKLDTNNSLLSGCSLYILRRPQNVKDSVAKRDHVLSLLCALHWLPVQAKIDYKLSTSCHNFSDSPPAYLSDLLTVYTPSRQLRSSADTRTLRVPHVKTKTFGQ